MACEGGYWRLEGPVGARKELEGENEDDEEEEEEDEE